MSVTQPLQRSYGVWVFSILALVFGLLTLKSGGSVLFIDGEARQAAGNYVPFVLWFNFSAGFVYIFAAISLWLMRPWVVGLSLFIAVSTLVVFSALAVHIMNGGAYEMRTVIAMCLRSIVWIVIAGFTWYRFVRSV